MLVSLLGPLLGPRLGSSAQVVAVERVLPVDPQTVFDLLADPAQHVRLDGSGSVRRVRAGSPHRLSQGARFGMDMRLALPYRISNVVVEFEEGRLIAWRHFVGHRWRYTLTPVAAGTRVREEWDPTGVPGLWPWYRWLRWPQRNRRGIVATLDCLEDLLVSGR